MDDSLWNDDQPSVREGHPRSLGRLQKEAVDHVSPEKFVTSVYKVIGPISADPNEPSWLLPEPHHDVLSDALLDALRLNRPRFRGSSTENGGAFIETASVYEDVPRYDLTQPHVDASEAMAVAAVLYANLEAPKVVRINQSFSIMVTLTQEALEHANSGALKSIELPPEGRELTLRVRSPDHVAFLSSAISKVRMYPGQDSAPIPFDCVIQAEGQQKIFLQVSDDTLTPGHLGQVAAAVEGTKEVAIPAAGQRYRSHAMGLRLADLQPFGRAISIEVERRDASTLAFRMSGPDPLQKRDFKTRIYQQPIDDIALGLRRQLNELATREHTGSDTSRDILHSVGVSVWLQILPESLQACLFAEVTDLTAICFFCDNLDIPWEVLAVPRQLANSLPDKNPFIGDHALITRWAFDLPQPSPHIRLTHPAYVVPDSAPEEAKNELQDLRRILGDGEHVRTFGELLALLRKPAFTILHFATHHDAEANVANGDVPAIELDARFDSNSLLANVDIAMSKYRPLVFINACGSAAAAPSWTASTGWAGAFLNSGAAAFIGNLWTLRDDSARTFAVAFYKQLLANASLGEAFLAARKAVKAASSSDDDATWLSYSLFGLPTARHAHEEAIA